MEKKKEILSNKDKKKPKKWVEMDTFERAEVILTCGIIGIVIITGLKIVLF